MDLKKILKEDKSNSNTNTNTNTNNSIKKYRKPVQLRDIESRSSNNKKKIEGEYKSNEDIRKLIEKEKQTIYDKPCNKLNYGQKMNLLFNFVDDKKIEFNLNDHETEKLKEILSNACENNKLNRNSDIIYDIHEKKIKEIKILDINDKKQFKLKNIEKKSKSITKSKSNIERFLKAGK